ncbi:MAG: putative quinol monooxygenase [Acidimicrobiales bacterium]
MTETAIFFKMTAHEGKGDELLAAASSILPTVEEEAGTLLYLLHRDDNDPDTIWMYERYADVEALGVHSSSDGIAALMGELGGLLAGAPMMVQATPVGGKGA